MVFGFLKKRREEELPMPPPPSPPELPSVLKGDLEEIRPAEAPPELPQLEIQQPLVPIEAPQPVVEEAPIVPEEVPEVVRPMVEKPLFVSVEDYKRIITDSNLVRAKLMEAENFVRRLADIKNEEEKAFDKWRTQLEDAEKKLSYVEHLIAKAQG